MSHRNITFQVVNSGQNYLGKLVYNVLTYSAYEYANFDKQLSVRQMLLNYIQLWLPEPLDIYLIGFNDGQILDADVTYDYVIDELNDIVRLERCGEILNFRTLFKNMGMVMLEDYDEDEYTDEIEEMPQDFIKAKYEDAMKRISFWMQLFAREDNPVTEQIYKIKLATQLMRRWKWTNNNYLKLRYNYSFTDMDELSYDYGNNEIKYKLMTKDGKKTGEFRIEFTQDRGKGQEDSKYYYGKLDGINNEREVIEMFTEILDENFQFN